MNPTREQIRRALYPAHAADALPTRGETARAPLRPAGVLVPLEHTGTGWRLLLTVRTHHLHTHAGQVSFPGGSLEPGDDGPVAAALREAEEEAGIAPAQVEIAGLLERYCTVTGFVMTPVVGILRPGYHLRRQPEEVDELFWMPLERALDRRNYHRQSLELDGRLWHFHAQEHEGRVVWGATAAILLGLGERLAARAGEADSDAV